jgi:hypothetical protein
MLRTRGSMAKTACPLLEGERTHGKHREIDAIDPKRTSRTAANAQSTGSSRLKFGHVCLLPPYGGYAHPREGQTNTPWGAKFRTRHVASASVRGEASNSISTCLAA